MIFILQILKLNINFISVPPPPEKALGAYLSKGKVFPIVFDC